ncbi:hypothetical protein [Mycobacterium sp. 155]|uniref:hypothetical protein n=1 Tax=Mycobacterium sp. 155 TaxID=1157943 RepID=UPI0003722BF2|nr:hypothetical protein [Mycobacterium sp. 155]
MRDPSSDDKFDELRRAWIARHQGWSTIQRRRAEQLGRKVRARQRLQSVAVPDPHDDTLLPPLWLRTTRSPASQVELVLMSAVVVLAPFGLIGGYVLKAVVTRLIPGDLRGYPIAVLLWAAAGLGAVIVVLSLLVYQPGASFGQVAVMPWICVQFAAVFAVAGVLGIAEGWLAVAASRLWFPRTPARHELTGAQADDILGGYDLTGPGLLDARRLNTPGERTR